MTQAPPAVFKTPANPHNRPAARPDGRPGGRRPAARRPARSARTGPGKKKWVAPSVPADAERRRENVDHTKAVPKTKLERMLSRRDIPLREKTLYRMLNETAARAEEILSLNVEDLGLDNRRAPVTAKGGDIEWVYWHTGTARLLPRLLRLPEGHPDGPVRNRGRCSCRRSQSPAAAHHGQDPPQEPPHRHAQYQVSPAGKPSPRSPRAGSWARTRQAVAIAESAPMASPISVRGEQPHRRVRVTADMIALVA